MPVKDDTDTFLTPTAQCERDEKAADAAATSHPITTQDTQQQHDCDLEQTEIESKDRNKTGLTLETKEREEKHNVDQEEGDNEDDYEKAARIYGALPVTLQEKLISLQIAIGLVVVRSAAAITTATTVFFSSAPLLHA